MRASLISTFTLLALGAGSVTMAQSFDQLMSRFYDESASVRETYFQPLADASAMLASSGTYITGKSHGVAGFDIGVRVPLVMLDGGVAGTILDEDVTSVTALGVPMICANKGLIKGFQVGARVMKLQLSEDVGDLTLFGGSVRWEANEIFHIPFVMPRVALQADYSDLKVGENLQTKGLTFDLIVSKKLAILEVYGGYTTGTLKSTFEYIYSSDVFERITVSDELDAKVSRLGLGVNVTPFPALRINGEYGMGDYNSLNVGLILSVL